ncbi:hypothetical protein [Amycolatopsis jiangsuensis]|uniref:DUF1795 domain-containing protein n=1 Tax=Amycolatopsis jiangsuensis TaxID=1181879 RepID=A0A840J5U7_9PSEU|nr:hypothetical protein [Amycolatopsis jiangsuensis]MBB4689079.1 hypothetical protein [Amycolatopsis jiangsuensis]
MTPVKLTMSMPEQFAELPPEQDPARRGELARAGVVRRGTCFARSAADPESLATAGFAVLVQEAGASGDGALDSLAEALAAQCDTRRITVEEFPAGEALLVEEPIERGRQAQVIFAFPDGQRIVLLGVTGRDDADWPDFRRLLKNVASSVSFGS